MKAVPQIISYATYVSATIHVRHAAQREPGSEAHKTLRRCVDILEIHQHVCWASQRAKRVVDRLIERMGIVLDTVESLGGASDLTWANFDIDAIIRTFPREQQEMEAQVQSLLPSFDTADVGSTLTGSLSLPFPDSGSNDSKRQTTLLPTDDMGTFYDPIFGFNGSAFDAFDLGAGGDFLWDG